MTCKVLAIDPGIKRVGWAVVVADPDSVSHLASGWWQTDDISFGLLLQVLREYNPDFAAVEKPNGPWMSDTAFIAGRIMGWIECGTAGQVQTYSAASWRNWLTGIPGEKDSVIKVALMEQVRLMPDRSNADQRDAIGLGLYAARMHTPGRRAA